MGRSVHCCLQEITSNASVYYFADVRIYETPAYIVLHLRYNIFKYRKQKRKRKRENLNRKKMCLYSIWAKSAI